MKPETAAFLEEQFNENEKELRSIKNLGKPALSQIYDDAMLRKKTVKRLAYFWAIIGVIWLLSSFLMLIQEDAFGVKMFATTFGLLFLFMSLRVVASKLQSETQLLILQTFMKENQPEK